MSTKAFMTLLIAVVLLGAGLGGAFAGGIALGKSQGDGETPSTVLSTTPPGSGQQAPSDTGVQSLDQLRQRLQSGEITQEELAEFRQQFQGQGGSAAGGGGFAGGGGLFGGRGGGGGGLVGTIEKVEGNVVTVTTQQGPLIATIGTDSTIQVFAEGTLDDIQAGASVTIIGQPGEDGTVNAVSITINPEGTLGFPTGGFGGFGAPRQQTGSGS